MVHDLRLELLDLKVTLINLFSHPLNTPSRLVFVSLQVLDLLIGSLQLVFLGLNQLARRTVLLITLLDLILFSQDQS